MENNLSNIKNTARLTGLLYFLVAVMGIFSYMYISPKIFIDDDISATAQNMLNNEDLFRTGILTDIISGVFFIAVVILLCRLLKHVNETQARLMLWFMMIVIPVSFIDKGIRFTTLYIFKGELLQSFSVQQRNAIAEMLLHINSYTGHFIMFHWGLWLMPLGWLVYKSGFIPRIFGILLWINGIGYIINSAAFILCPDSFDNISKIIFPTYFMGELPLIFWLLIAGAKRRVGDSGY